MTQQSDVAIAGATGEVGRALLDMLETAGLPIGRIHVLASAGSVDDPLMYGSRPLIVESLDDFDFSTVQFVVLALPADVAMVTAERALEAGCRVIDHSTAWHRDDSVPLVLDGDVTARLDAELVSCPGAPAALLAPVLNVLDEEFGIESAQATLLLPVSSRGRRGVRELAGQTGELLNARGIEPSVFPVQIAFNCLPLVGLPSDDQEDEASRLSRELEKLLHNPVPVTTSLVRMPVFYGQCASLVVQTATVVDLQQAAGALARLGVNFPDPESDQGVATPVTDAAGQDGVYISGLQALPAPLRGLQLWLTADNVRQGAARHSLYILKNWIKDFKY